MEAKLGQRWQPVLVVLILLWCDLLMVCCVQPQNTPPTATTAPAEAHALNLALAKWGTLANTQQWNTTGDPCSGAAIDDSASYDDYQYNPFIKCDCSYDANTTCHITALRVYSLDALGVIPDELWNLVYLTKLDLGQNFLTGPISSGIGNLTQMQYLDLSFNSLIGQIPTSLFNLDSLNYLFLGNNKLNGSLPTQKSASLVNIDVSHNRLSGSLPSWVSVENLQLNLVANNFSVAGSNSRALRSGLNCIQNDFPCKSGLGCYADFAINSGGPQIRSSNQVVYESDSETLGPTNYFVSNSDKWAVSNVGLFSGNHNVSYIASSSHMFTSLDPELFGTARVSAGSLRYYGLGLQNGNYRVLLQFAEIQIEDGKT